jgi:hypothetical protein
MKLIAVGIGLDTIAAAVGVGIWQAHPHGGFLQVPGWITIGAFVLGASLVLAGLLTHERATEAGSMTQSAGDGANQYQAGRDIRLSPTSQRNGSASGLGDSENDRRG